MIITFIAFLSLAGVIGVCMQIFSARISRPRRITLLSHGCVSLTGLFLLLFYSFGEIRQSIESVALFAVASVGGLYMLMRDLAGKFTPSWAAFLHGMLAIGGFTFIIYNCMQD